MNQQPSAARIILASLLIATLAIFSIDSYLPSLPSMVDELHTTNGFVQLTLSTYLLSFAISQLFYGIMSERYGRRRMLLIGYAVFMFGTFICMSVQTIEGILFGRFLQGLGAGAGSHRG